MRDYSILWDPLTTILNCLLEEGIGECSFVLPVGADPDTVSIN